jgi:hypothetical protein
MTYRILSIVAALAALLFTGCSKSGSQGNQGSQVQIVSAVYGEYTNFADVSYRVRDLIRLDTGFQVQPSFLQADPFVGYHKVLVIVYDVKGQRHIFTAYENDTVSTKTLLEAARQ